MDVVFIFPPQWVMTSPSTGLPELSGYVKQYGHKPIVFDLNVDFYNHVLNNSFVEQSLSKAKRLALEINKNIDKHDEDSSLENKESEYKKHKIKYINNILTTEQSKLEKIPNYVDTAVKTLKSKNSFYHPILLNSANYIIKKALEIISLPYYPLMLGTNYYYNVVEELKYDNIKFFTTNKNYNVFIEYYESIVNKILDIKPKLIGISINSESQLIPGLTLARILKNKYKGHISIGGAFIESMEKHIRSDSEFFNLYADSAILGLGEIPIINILEYLDNKRKLNNIPNIIYLNESGNIIANKESDCSLKKISAFSYEGYDFKQYFLPEIVLPLRVSHGCYWGKCVFCDIPAGKSYNPKSVDSVILEIQEQMKKYNTKYFYFVDAALPPSFMEEFSNKIIDRKIDIRYNSNLRFEKEFDKKLLSQMYKSGMRLCAWGLESASSEILKKMNKGTTINNSLKILKNAHSIGLANHVYFIIGFPGESFEDYKKTMDFLLKNRKYINSFAHHEFVLSKSSYMFSHLEEFDIDLLQIKNAESTHYHSLTTLGIPLTEKQLKIFNNVYSIYIKDLMPLVYNSMAFESKLLYSDKYQIKFKYLTR